jgi:hypothetical protein
MTQWVEALKKHIHIAKSGIIVYMAVLNSAQYMSKCSVDDASYSFGPRFKSLRAS